MKVRLVIAVATAVACISMASVAFGQDNPTQDAYGGQLGEIVSGGTGGTGGGATGNSDKTLPFTGYDTMAIGAAGLVLLVGGFALRRRLRPDQNR